MGENTVIRKPKQKRSIETAEKILDTAYRLICEKGYYNTTTNEIAKVAGVPIGSLYAYFKDKDTIFMELLRRYHQTFAEFNAGIREKFLKPGVDIKLWLRALIEELIRLHENGLELNREMQIVCHTNPDVAALLKIQLADSRNTALAFFRVMKDDMHVADHEAAANVAYDTISAIVDRIVLDAYEIDRDRIIDACVEEIYKFLLL